MHKCSEIEKYLFILSVSWQSILTKLLINTKLLYSVDVDIRITYTYILTTKNDLLIEKSGKIYFFLLNCYKLVKLKQPLNYEKPNYN